MEEGVTVPKIPVYNRQVETASLPNVRVANVVDPKAYGVGANPGTADALASVGRSTSTALSQAAHGAEQGNAMATRGMGQLGAVIAERAQKLQTEQDYSDVLNATQGWMKEVNSYLYDPNSGVMNKKGYDARGVGEKALTDLESAGRKYGDKLKNARQQQMFQRYVGDHLNSTASELYRHEAREHRVALEKDTSANIELLIDGALKSGDFDKVNATFGQIEGLVRSTWGGLGDNTVKEQMNKYKTLYHSEKVKAIFQNDAVAADAYLEEYKKDMDPAMYTKLKEVVGNRVKDISMNSEAEQIVAAAGGDYAKAIELARNSKPVSAGWNGIRSAAEKQLGKPYQLGADGKNKTDCGQYTLEVFQQNGIDLKSRDVSEQARMLNEKGGFTTDSTNLKPGDLVFYKNTYQPPEGHGFNNITHAAIYAGNGKIIHAGSSKGVTYASIDDPGEIAGYGTPGGSGSADPIYKEKLESRVMALMNREKAIKADAEHQEMVRVENALASTDDPVQQLEIVNSSGLEPRHAKNLLKQIVDSAKRKESDAAAYTELLALKIDGKLTPEKVSEYGQLLTRKDYFSFLGESLEIAKKTQVTAEKEADNLADKAWKTSVEGLGSGRQRYEKDQLIQSIAYTLDNEKLKGDARRVRALEMIKQDKENRGAIFKQVSGDQDKWAFLTDAWGEGSINGLKKAGLSPDVAEQFLMSIDRGDWLQNEALRLLIAGGKPINKENFDTVMFRLASVEHPFKPFEMK